MDWKKEAVNELKLYVPRKASLKNLKDRIRVLNENYVSLKEMCNDTPVMGTKTPTEEKLINNIVEREKLSNNLKAIEELLRLTEQGLTCLTERQRSVIEELYINKGDRSIDHICQDLHIEKTRLYEIKDEALYRFTVGTYGFAEF